MSRKGVTYEEVASTAWALIQEGKRVTAAAVRERLGRGSMTTIQRHLQAWREKEAPAQAVEKSEALQAMLERLSKELELPRLMAEQVASLYRAFKGPETERTLKKLAVEFERSRKELERYRTWVRQLQESVAQTLAKQLRQDLERLQKPLEGLDLEKVMTQARSAQNHLKQLAQETLSAPRVMRPPEIAPAPRAGGAEVEELARRLQALERRLERLERGGHNGG
jgi:vancomycin resistance protein YoaR